MAKVDLKAMAKAAGVSDEELKGKSLDEQISILSAALTNAKKELALEDEGEFISNSVKQLGKLKDDMKTPFEIWVSSVAQKKSRTKVPVVGYIPETSEFVVYYNNQLSPIKDDQIVKSVEALAATKQERTAKKK